MKRLHRSARMTHALLANDTTAIQDARNDDRFHDNPLVTGQPGIRFHAGRPSPRRTAYPSTHATARTLRRRTRPARQREIVVLLSVADPADVGEPVARAAQRGRRTRLRDPVQCRSRRIRTCAASYGRRPLDSADRHWYEDNQRGKGTRA